MTHPDKLLRRLLPCLACLPSLLQAAPPAPAEVLSVPVAQHDTLIGLAQRLLEKPAQWPRLQALNQIADPLRLKPGSQINIPLAMLRGTPAQAQVESVQGEVRGAQGPLAAGSLLGKGDTLSTGPASYAVLRLPDGSRINVQPDSQTRIELLQQLAAAGTQQSRLGLSQGRIETKVQPQRGPAARYEIRTPTAVIGVRGTEFRAGFDGSASRVEVTAGLVAANRSTALPAGQGAVLDAQGTRTEALLPTPALGAIPTLFERPLLRIPLPETTGAASHRVIIAGAAGFAQPLAEQQLSGREARIAGLPDGDYRLRLRAISAAGLEGQDGELAFRLKARPEPPFMNPQGTRGKLQGEQVQLSWTEQTDAARYRIQVADNTGFAAPVFTADDLAKTTLSVPLAPGDYQWRLASVRADGDRGPWGDPAAFTLKAPQGPPEPPQMDDKQIQFAWPGEAGQRFEFEMARDMAFTRIATRQESAEARLALARPEEAGDYFIRVRATDPDGFVGNWSTPQHFLIEKSQPWWLLALPLLIFAF